jgi:hypothetical protein
MDHNDDPLIVDVDINLLPPLKRKKWYLNVCYYLKVVNPLQKS